MHNLQYSFFLQYISRNEVTQGHTIKFRAYAGNNKKGSITATLPPLYVYVTAFYRPGGGWEYRQI